MTTHTVIDRLRPYIEKGEISGAGILVAKKGRILEQDVAGFADLNTKLLMKKNDLFWVASMTKPIVSTAILMLSDEGKLSVDDPVEKHLPEFKDMWVITEKTDDRMTLAKSSKPPTLRHLLAHTDGLTDVPPPFAETPLAEWVTAVSRLPLQFPPGSKWAYNNSGMNALGRIIEVVSGKSLPEFLKECFFKPLGMKDTTFILSQEQKKRLVTWYRLDETDGKLHPTTSGLFKSTLTSKRLTICPGGGLFSTATDIFRFYQMLLDGGVSKGRRYLSKKAFKEMTTHQTGEMETGFTEGMAFGLGVGMVRQAIGLTAMLSKGTFGHGGVFGTQAWIDPVRKSLMILMIQRSNLGNADAGDLRHAFNNAVAELVSGKKSA
jgi:CubicO group peptidase (beta-lactamase class C family)